MGAARYSFNGRFDPCGRATNIIARARSNPLTLVLQVDVLGNGRISGSVSDGSWTANLVAGRALPKTQAISTPPAGRYTLLLPGTGDPADTGRPQGDGFGRVTVTASALVQFRGTLADGTPLTLAATLSQDGRWPFYASMYGGKGQMLGWLAFTNMEPSDIGGAISWLKPPGSGTRYYPNGFELNLDAVGSIYQPHVSTASPGPNASESVVILTGGGLARTITNNLVPVTPRKGTRPANNTAWLTFLGPDGVFAGEAANPDTGKRLLFRGAMLQSRGIGSGFFLGTEQSGEVLVLR